LPDVLDAKFLESFSSLADFAELLEVTKTIPARELLELSAGRFELKPDPAETLVCLERSRFRFLVEHIPTAKRPVVAESLLDFLKGANFLFIQLVDSNRKVRIRRDKRGHERRTQTAEAGQRLVGMFRITIRPLYLVSEKGTLLRQRELLGVDPTPALTQRFMEVLEGADSTRVRQCAFVECRRVFYARRADQLCCSGRCNNNRLQREWYGRHGKSAVYERAGHKERES
jgi:hypothetical protein